MNSTNRSPRRPALALAAVAAMGGGLATSALFVPQAPPAYADNSGASLPTAQTEGNGPQRFYAYMETGGSLDVNFDVQQFKQGTPDSHPVYARVVVRDSANTAVFTRTVRLPDTGSVSLEGTGIKGASGVWTVTYYALDENYSSTGVYGTLADWQIVTRDASGTAKAGRLWADEYVGNQKLKDNLTAGRRDVRLYYLSDTGAAYRALYSGYLGGTSVFSADSLGLGFSNCTPRYASTSMLTSTLPTRAGDCPSAQQYRVFFSTPDSSMPETATAFGGRTWVYPKYTAPSISRLGLTRTDPRVSPAGTITYNVAGQPGMVDLLIDTSGTGTFDPANVVKVTTRATLGTNTYAWDGRDADGNLVPADRDLHVRVNLSKVGEIHFVNEDAEVRSGGLEVTQLSGPNPGSQTLSWNDTSFAGQQCWDAETQSTRTTCDTPNPESDNALFGNNVSSDGGVHRWDGPTDANGTRVGTWGNLRFIDDWTYMSDTASATAEAPAPDPNRGLVAIDKTHTFGKDTNGDGRANIGDQIIYNFRVSNAGTEPLSNVRVADDMLAAANVAITCPKTTLAVGESMDCTSAPYTVTAQDVASPQITNIAVARADDPVGPVNEPQDPDVVPTGVYTPGIGLVKNNTLADDQNNDGNADEGDTIKYTFDVTNTGNVDLELTGWTDQRLDTAGIKITCPQVNLAVGETITCDTDKNYTVTAADEGGATILNTATVRGVEDPDVVGPDGRTVSDTDDVELPTGPDPRGALALDKTGSISNDQDGDNRADEGDEITYTFRVTNTTAVPLTNVKVTDPMLDGAGVAINCPKSTLSGNESMTCTSDPYTVTADDILSPIIRNVATATGDDPKGPVPEVQDPHDTPTGPAKVEIGDYVWLDADKDGVQKFDEEGIADITVTIKDETGKVVATTKTDSEGKWSAMVDPGAYTASFELKDKYKFTGKGLGTDTGLDSNVDEEGVTETFTVTAGTPDLTIDAGMVPPGTPEIDLVKTSEITSDKGTKGRADEGDGVTYGFRVTNTGTVDLVDVKLDDDRLASADVDITCPKAELAVGESMDCKSAEEYIVTAEDAKKDSLVNVASVVGTSVEDPEDKPSDEDTNELPTPTPPGDPKLTLEKDVKFSKDEGTKGKADKGDVLRYEFKVTNAGKVKVDELKIDDSMLKGAKAKISCERESLEPGQSTTCTSEGYTVTAADAAKPEITNVAYAIGTDPEGDPVRSNTDKASVPTPKPVPAPVQTPAPQPRIVVPSGVPLVAGPSASDIALGAGSVVFSIGAAAAYIRRRKLES